MVDVGKRAHEHGLMVVSDDPCDVMLTVAIVVQVRHGYFEVIRQQDFPSNKVEIQNILYTVIRIMYKTSN